jgi:hypothetical protein
MESKMTAVSNEKQQNSLNVLAMAIIVVSIAILSGSRNSSKSLIM